MELKDYTTEQLKAELKRRVELARIQKAEEMKTALRCRNCKHCQAHKVSNLTMGHKCIARIWGKKNPRHYVVSLSQKACDLFERKE